MTDLVFVVFAIAIIVIAIIANIAVWSRSRTSLRILAVLLTLVFIPHAYISVNELLSRPKPMANEWFKRHVDEAVVLSVEFAENEAIYLWLRLDEEKAPRFYTLPWRRQLADRLEDLVDEGLRTDKLVKITNPFTKRSFDDLGDMNIEIVEPPSLPLKLPPQAVEAFDPRKDAI